MAPRNIIDWRQLNDRFGRITIRRTLVSGQLSEITIGKRFPAVSRSLRRGRQTLPSHPEREGIAAHEEIQANLSWISKKSVYGI
jgi:hypothetical protein